MLLIFWLPIDDSLILKAKKIGKHKNKKETVTKALVEYIERHEQKKIIELFDTIEYDNSYSYKDHRTQNESVGRYINLVYRTPPPI